MHCDLVFVSKDTLRLLGDLQRNDHVLLISKSKDQQQQRLHIGLAWPNASISDHQVSISRTILEDLADKSMIELRVIVSNSIPTIDSINLRYRLIDDR